MKVFGKNGKSHFLEQYFPAGNIKGIFACFYIDQRLLLKTSSIYNIQYVDAGSSLRCSPSPSVITACLIRRKTIRNCSEMFGNDQVSEMFVPNTIFG